MATRTPHNKFLALTALTAAASITLIACSTTEENSDAKDTTAAENTTTTQTTTESATEFTPVTIDNCGFEVTVEKQPSRIISLNQGATESLLAIGANDQMVGTAYLDDEIDPDVKDAYEAIPVLDPKYPSHEKIVDERPDLITASYASAFDDKVAGDREELQKLGIASYLDPFGCKDKDKRSPATWEAIKKSITELGALTGDINGAQDITTTIDNEVAKAKADKPGEGKTVFWWDSKTDTPFAGAGQGGPQLLLDTVGATNVFSSLDGNWADTSWEAVLEANPDYIVVADASWDTAADKIAFAKADPSLKELDAVKNDRFISVPFSESTPNVRTVKAIKKLQEGLSR